MNPQKLLTWVTAILENLLFAGAIFGWPNFVSVLEKEKFFNDSCTDLPENSTSCPGQSNSLSLVLTLSLSIALFTATLTGKLLDKYGIWVVRTVMINLAVVCYIVVASVPNTSSYALYVCFPIIHICGFTLHAQKMLTANLFAERRNLFVATVCGAFDSGALMFLVFNKLYFDVNVGYKTLLYLNAAAWFLLNVRTFTLTPKHPVPNTAKKSYTYGYKEVKGTFNGVLNMLKCVKGNENAQDQNNNLEIKDDDIAETPKEEKLKKYLLKKYYITGMISVVITNFLCIFYISNFNTFIEGLVDKNKDEVTRYSNIFGMIQLTAVIFAPAYGILVEFYQKRLKDKSVADIRSCLVGIWASCGTAVLFLIFMLIPSAKAQIVTMILVVMTSSFFFSANCAFMTSVLPPKFSGQLFGLLSTVNGAALLLQQPLRLLVTNVLGGSFVGVTVGLLVVSLLLFLHPLCIMRNLKNIKHERLDSRSRRN